MTGRGGPPTEAVVCKEGGTGLGTAVVRRREKRVPGTSQADRAAVVASTLYESIVERESLVR